MVGKPLPRPDVPGKVTGPARLRARFRVDGMLHGRVIRPPAVGAKLVAVDEASIGRSPACASCAIKDFLGVVAENEWDAVSAARALKATWSERRRADRQRGRARMDARRPVRGRRDAGAARAMRRRRSPARQAGQRRVLLADADARLDGAVLRGRRRAATAATIWTASQATHRFRQTFARLLGLAGRSRAPRLSRRRRLLRDERPRRCGGRRGAAVARGRAAGARAMDARGRARLGSEGPPQLLALEGAVGADGKIAAWRTEMWLPKATANLPNVPLLGAEAAGIAQTPGISTGLISQNGDPPYAVAHQEVVVHWLKDAPLRPSNIRAPGKIANSFAVESFTDELAAAAGGPARVPAAGTVRSARRSRC